MGEEYTINGSPEITQQPDGGSRYVGDSFTFDVAASGGVEPLTYQWRHDGSNMDGETSTALALGPPLSLEDAGNYDCVVSDSGVDNVTSNPATLNVAEHLAITLQPQSATVVEDNPHTLYVEASGGYPPLTYQWTKDGTALTGANASAYGIALFSMDDVGTYSVSVGDNLTDVRVSDPADLVFAYGAPVAGFGGLAAIALATGLLGALRLRRQW